uniref:Uncharacterized protein n=1 Tax=viral metagenome TaxID=1070528 RepID=A0A6C0L9T7_9ZZZZ
MNYSTLQEAYNIDTFERKSRPSNKSNKSNGSSTSPSNTSPSFVETSKLALSSNKLSDYPNNHGSSCSPLQAPTYNIPISNECKREHDEAMNVYTNANNNMNNMMNNIPSSINNNNLAANGANGVNSVNASNTNNNNNLQLSQPQTSSQAPLLPSQNLFNSLKSSDNVMPYYDEDLEQYFNISNLNDEVKYNSNSYMPNSNKQPYTNNDTSEYTNSNAVLKNGNNLLNNSSYNLTPEEKKSADEAIAYLKSIEDKINNGSMNSSGYNKTSIADPVIPPVNKGPGGFKTPEKPVEKVVEKVADKPIEKSQEKSDNNYIYNAIFNISILLIIGIAIILLCDQMVELSIQIGMKRVVNILEPFIKANAAAAAAAQQAQQSA